MALPPLTERQKELCKRLENACKETEEYLQACKACGLDVTDEIIKNNEQLEVVKGIKVRWPN